ncbi:MAG: helix-turn-helix domain-containing protein [Halovenus sp.]
MIAQFRFETGMLEPTLRNSDVSSLDIEGLDATRTIPLRTVFRCREDSLESTLSTDPSVAAAAQVAETERGSLYQAIHREPYADTAIYHEAVRHGGVFATGTSRRENWELRMRFPDREQFGQFRGACAEQDMSLQVNALYETRSATRAERYGISEPQEEIIHLAARSGYFDVPREVSLTDLADELDVSTQAASERLRRGLGTLVEAAGFTPE